MLVSVSHRDRATDRSADGESSAPAISPDGGHVSFSSDAPDVVDGDGNHRQDVFLRDLGTGRTQMVSLGRGGRTGQNRARAGGFAAVSDVSRGGKFVAFESDATNLAGRDRNGRTDIFVRDTVRRSTRRVSLSTTNEEGSGASVLPTITPDGRYVAFSSRADDLVAKNTVGLDIFVRDVIGGGTVLVDVNSEGRPRSRARAGRARPALAQRRRGHRGVGLVSVKPRRRYTSSSSTYSCAA